MQDGGTGIEERILGFTPVTHPRRSATARMTLVHLRLHLRVIGPVARHLDTPRFGLPERTSNVSRDHRMQMHLVPGRPMQS